MTAQSNTRKALAFALEQSFTALPDPSKTFFLRAAPLEGTAGEWQRNILNVQSFKPYYDQLQQAGCMVGPDLNALGSDLGIIQITKHKQENLANLARCWTALRPGGRLMCVGSNDVGVSSVEKAIKTAFEYSTSQSKYHCKIISAQRGETLPDILPQWAKAGELQFLPTLSSWSQPGIYNWNKIDAGSALLIQSLPADLQGQAADLGAGWGYLSQQLLMKNPKISSVDLYEAESLALNAAKANLAPYAKTTDLRYHWHDVSQGLPPDTYDLVIMNPPFHDGKAVDIELGRAFITSAAQTLSPGGKLYMVANRQLPYEETLNTAFGTHTQLAESALYKVLSAEKLPVGRTKQTHHRRLR